MSQRSQALSPALFFLLGSCPAGDPEPLDDASTSSGSGSMAGSASLGTLESGSASTSSTMSSDSAKETSASNDSGTGSSTNSGSDTGPPAVDCGDVVHAGNLTITDTTDPEEATAITHVTGNVSVTGTTALEDLMLLANLACVDQELVIEFNDALSSIDGLENLRRVGQRVVIGGNPVLSNADALQGLAQASGLRVMGNPMLIALPPVADDFWLLGPSQITIGSNGFQDLSGLFAGSNLTVTGGVEVTIYLDQVLRSTQGVGALGVSDAPADLSILGDEANVNVLEEIDLAGFEELNNLLIESSFPAIQTLDAPDLTRVNRLSLFGLEGLDDLSGLSSLEEVSGWMKVGCGSLSGGGFTSLEGLESLASAPVLVIGANPNLISIDALATSLGTEALAIMNNEELPGADVDAYAAAVGSANEYTCGNLGQPGCGQDYDCFAFD